MRTLILSLIFAALGLAQTTTNGGSTVLGPVDFSGATTTKPVKTGTTAPATCGVGEVFFDTDATAGSNVFGCTATNTWTLQGGSYTLPIAAAGTLGGIKVGTNLSIDGGGVLSASSGSAAICDPGDPTLSCLVEEFQTGTTTSGSIGKNGMKFSAVSSGTLAFVNVGSTAITQRPGVVSVTSTAVANSGGVVQASNTSTVANMNFDDLLNENWEISWIFRVDSVSDTRIRLGLSATSTSLLPATSEPSFILRYDTDAAFSDNTKGGTGVWVAQFCGYSGLTCADTAGVYYVTATAPTTNWTKATISKSGTTYTWKVNDVSVATMCPSACNMTTPSPTSPTASYLSPYVSFGISSTTQRNIYLDWMLWKLSGLTRY